MTGSEFRRYRKSIEPFLARALAHGRNEQLDEQALPSYTHENRLMAWMFWKRVHVILQLLERDAGRLLDFGCGAGVLLPALVRGRNRVTACDVDLGLAQRLAAEQGLEGIEWLESDARLAQLPEKEYDTILCLDVLEHVESVRALAAEFHRILKPDGRLIVCGPTESPIYRLGRRLAGFSGHYHLRSIYDIEAHLKDRFEVTVLRRLGWPLTLFRIVAARPLV
jgi:2-polyprenyl-3-methyl-5-hydroxy-6-metoxy-1,4-benzoquinol methylase